jgi:hypothetical protein
VEPPQIFSRHPLHQPDSAVMQNRLVITQIPPSVTRLPNAADTLRDVIEEHGCWVDRFAFLSHHTSTDAGCITAAAELHIENVRDKAVKSLDRLSIVLDREGNLHRPTKSVDDTNDNHAIHQADNIISFIIRAHPANAAQSKELVATCPIESGDADDSRMERQVLQLPNDVELTVYRSAENGGTGTTAWRGGLILSRQLCHWLHQECISQYSSTEGESSSIDFNSLFRDCSVLELGAGSAGLPSMTLAKLCNSVRGDALIVASDGVDEIVNALKMNIAANGLDDCVEVRHVDWNDYTTTTEDKDLTRAQVLLSDAVKADTILFADCIYNEEGAIALSDTIRRLLKPEGNVIGVLPDFRVGIDFFESVMKLNGFLPTDVAISEKEASNAFVCCGSSGKDYRLLWWKHTR